MKIANRHGNSYSVSPISGPKGEDNIQGGGVHQWYMTFGHQCPISIVFFSINFKIKEWGLSHPQAHL